MLPKRQAVFAKNIVCILLDFNFLKNNLILWRLLFSISILNIFRKSKLKDLIKSFAFFALFFILQAICRRCTPGSDEFVKTDTALKALNKVNFIAFLSFNWCVIMKTWFLTIFWLSSLRLSYAKMCTKKNLFFKKKYYSAQQNDTTFRFSSLVFWCAGTMLYGFQLLTCLQSKHTQVVKESNEGARQMVRTEEMYFIQKNLIWKTKVC